LIDSYEGYKILRYNGEFLISDHIIIFDDVKEKLAGLGCNIVRKEIDSNESKCYLLIAQKVSIIFLKFVEIMIN
jgi:hypothetical protein